jgi:hypothetical protein
MLDLSAQLVGLPRSITEGAFSVKQITGFRRHYVGRDHEGRSCILIGSTDAGVRAPLRLTGLSVQYALTCVVHVASAGEAREVLTVLTCTTPGPEAERYFLHVMGTLIELVGDDPTLHIVSEAVARIASIFQRLSLPSRANLAGLIGELVIIALAADPVSAADSWRVDVDERYDFVCGNLRLEAKSSTIRRRSHGASFEQCDIPADCIGVLASVFIERSAGGTSVRDLLGIIGTRLAAAPGMMLRLEQTLADTLGAGLLEALNFSFDLDLAGASLEFYDLSAVPAVRGVPPVGVSQIRFVTDLSGLVPLSTDQLVELCPPFDIFRPEPVEPLMG